MPFEILYMTGICIVVYIRTHMCERACTRKLVGRTKHDTNTIVCRELDPHGFGDSKQLLAGLSLCRKSKFSSLSIIRPGIDNIESCWDSRSDVSKYLGHVCASVCRLRRDRRARDTLNKLTPFRTQRPTPRSSSINERIVRLQYFSTCKNTTRNSLQLRTHAGQSVMWIKVGDKRWENASPVSFSVRL